MATGLAIAATGASKAEGNSGSTAFTFTVTRSGDTTGASSATYTVTGSGANAATAADFTGAALATGTVSFAAGEVSKLVTINVAGDTTVEANEGFTVTLSAPSAGTTITTAAASGTIVNDDASLAIAATDASKAEGNSGSTAFTFTVTRSGNTTGASSATYTVTGSGGNAANATDFTGAALPTGTVSFAAGEVSKLVTINVAGDTTVEANEGFTVTLSAPSAGTTITTTAANGTITNDDASLAIAATGASKAEGNSGSTPFTFTVTRSGNTTGASSATYTVTGSGGNAATAADFTGAALPTGTVSFAAGEVSKLVTINVAGDTTVETNEGFRVTLSAPSAGTTITTAAATGTIINDDTSLAIAATDASKAEGNSGSTPFTFTVTRSGNTTGASSATYTVTGSGGNAATAADFTGAALPTGTVSFAAGEVSKLVTINVAGDTTWEANEGFTVTLSAPSAGTTITTAAASGTIVSDDAASAIVLENQKPGTPQSVWQIAPGADSQLIQGFTTSISTNVGGAVNFKVNNQTGTANYRIDIYRLGYYGGDGATLVTTLQHQATSAVIQPAPLTNPLTGMVDAGNWSVTDSWTVPTTATSGVYIANVIDGSQVFQIPFIVRDDSSHSNIVFQTSDETWQAYNAWGGNNLYGGTGPGNDGAAYAVSYNRPITTRDGTGTGETGTANDMLFSAEFPAIYWLEENGYDVSYLSGIDAATNGSLLLNHQVYMDAGHDEYWTDSQRANVQAAADAGVNLVFMSGNEMFWQTRLQPSIDGSGSANRTLVSYKDTQANALIDPSGTATGTFMDARFASTGGMSGLPSNSLTGTVFQVNGGGPLGTITIPYGETNLRIWRNTSVANTAPGQSVSLVPNLLGFEWDTSPDNGFRPAGLIDLSSTTLQISGKYLLDYGSTYGDGTATHNLVEYRDAVSGALVFSAGTVFWSWGLSADHDQLPQYGAKMPADPNVQQAMVNLLADMGVQPSTLQATLQIATRSTDHTAPTSTITQVSTTNPAMGQSVTVTGTASDVGGVVAGVEVSTDGGNTWHPAISQVGATTVNWTYIFQAGPPGTTTIKSRAVDDSVNLAVPGTGVTYTITPVNTIFSPTATPAIVTQSDLNAVELGVKFSSSVSGNITGIRFYKGPLNIGTHIGDLWSSNGTLLATATFTNETASGWQQANFSNPVPITAGTTYTASYHTNGDYSVDRNFFANSLSNGALTAPSNAGVFAYSSASAFPTNSYIGSNYWVDVTFNGPPLQPPVANNDSGFVATPNTALPIPASALLANDTDPNGFPLSITGVSNPSHGTVTYNSSTQTISFVPTTGYVGSAGFTYTISDGQVGTASANVALTVNPGQSLFTGNTPATITQNDPNPVELGVKFQAATTGTITGIRFYKGPQNTGPHVADLWSATGNLLATATFTNETASGWQQVNLSTPVVVTAGTTYVASYHTNGFYSYDANYFNTAYTNGSLTALASGTSGGNGVFAYGSSDLFPTNTVGSNYWVDVVFDGSPLQLQPPVANNDSGFVAITNTALPIPASALLANDTDPNGLPLSITGVSNPSHGTATYNSSTQTISFVPTTGYVGSASFTYSTTDGQGTASANVSLTVNPGQSLFTGNTPATITQNDPNPVELGVKFQAATTGTITGIRFYKGPQNTGPHVADLWSATGNLLATATFTNETASGWQQVNLSTPVVVTAGTTYVASYHTNGFYSYDANYFNTAYTNGSLTALASGTSGGNGVFAYGSSDLFPTNTVGSNYWVDVVFDGSPLPPQPPVANNDSGFVAITNTALPIPASALLANDTDPNGLPLSITGVSNPSHGTATYNSSTQTISFVPTTGYVGSASFTYSTTDGQGTASANVSLTVNDASLFSHTATPSIVTQNDPNSVELGVKFQAATNGSILGIEFYKGPQNTGPHVADLWSATGALLATATFTNETASGWQQVNFSNPVPITAGTTYIASYHTNGFYSRDPNLFASALTNGPLTAPASSTSGGNGVFAYGSSSLFPTNNNLTATSYAVDVIFRPQLVA